MMSKARSGHLKTNPRELIEINPDIMSPANNNIKMKLFTVRIDQARQATIHKFS
jgi:hypothetical protein